MAVKR
jgi:hypothetical protein